MPQLPFGAPLATSTSCANSLCPTHDPMIHRWVEPVEPWPPKTFTVFHVKSKGKSMVNPMVNAHEFLANPSSDIHQLGFIWDLYHPHLGKSDHSQTTLCTVTTTMGTSQGFMEINGPKACPDLGVRIVDQIEQCLSMVGSLPSPNASKQKARCQGTSLLF